MRITQAGVLVGTRAIFASVILMCAACLGNSESADRKQNFGTPAEATNTYVNLLDLEDHQRFWWANLTGLEIIAVNQSSGSDVLQRLAVCESAQSYMCFDIQPGYSFRAPCEEAALSNLAPDDKRLVGFIARRTSPYGDLQEYIFELGNGPTRMRVGYVYSVGITFFLYLQSETVRDDDVVITMPKSNTFYVAVDGAFDPVPVICAK